jgi:acetoacetyl-CoA synthetase
MSKLLWKPSEKRLKGANITNFIYYINRMYDLQLSNYDELYEWSVSNIPEFWLAVWDFLGIISSKPFNSVVDDVHKLPGAKWFDGAKLNFAQNPLQFRDKKTAIIFKGEGRSSVRITYAELYNQVARLAKSLREFGVKPGDRVAGFMPNMKETIVAMLAATSMGSIWSSCSPDFGIKGVLDRFGQIKPKVLFTADGYYFNGKKFDSLERVKNILTEIASIEKVVVVPCTENTPDISDIHNSILFGDFLSKEANPEMHFEQLPAGHPLYIMFTSGTTGLPKCMVQGAAGVLINQMKELKFHTDVKRDDIIFYFTTCGWMMWNWLVCSLSLGATVLLYDGSPFYPNDGALWKLAQDEGITIFGTSARYLAEIERRGVKPRKEYDLSKLRAILSTGSSLSVDSFEYVYRDIKQDVLLSSISGGSDINGCFATGNPIGPVYSGEIQKRCLGMKVEVFDGQGNSIVQQKGELVCTAAAPSMPLYFWDDPDGSKYYHAYFDIYPGVWRHGDYAEITEHEGVIMYGRSDATLNPGGVRIGTAEIYRQVETMDEIEDSLVVGQDWDNDVRVILFVKLKDSMELTDELVNKIKTTIKMNATPRHVPAKIIPVADIPYTINMKKVELAVKKVIEGKPVLNTDALSNPQSLELYKNIRELGR